MYTQPKVNLEDLEPVEKLCLVCNSLFLCLSALLDRYAERC